MVKICFLMVVLITHSVNILLECIEKNTFFKIGEQFKVAFSNSSREKYRLKLSDNSETFVEELIF